MAVAEEDTIIVYATFPNIETATEMATMLINSRIAGCVNMLPGMTSVYRWEGGVETAQEIVMIVKTRASLRGEIIAAIEQRHPYDTPAIVAWDINGGSRRYLDWIIGETKNS